MATFGERFKLLRREKNITQEKLANMFFLNKSSISRYEKDKQIPEMDLLQKFADFFNVTVDYLLGRSDIKNSHLSEQNNQNKINTNSEQENFADDIMKILIKSGELKEGEVVSEEKKERLLNMIKKAIEISKL